jgi:pimeloyl-ACP methyl ester carboxylesterase
MGRFALLPPEDAFRLGIENALADETVASRPELVEEILAYRLAHPPRLDGWAAQAAAGGTFDGSAQLGRLRMPTLVMHGTADNVVDARNAPLLADAIPEARLERFEGLGHLFFYEEPDRVARALREYLL